MNFPHRSYVLFTLSGTLLVTLWHAVRIGPFRKLAALPYPIVCAPYESSAVSINNVPNPDFNEAHFVFNCAQRAHGNFLENLPTVLPTLLVAGLKFPLLATTFGVCWNVSRVLYAVGYTRPAWGKDGAGRLKGQWYFLFQLGLIVMTGLVGMDLL